MTHNVHSSHCVERLRCFFGRNVAFVAGAERHHLKIRVGQKWRKYPFLLKLVDAAFCVPLDRQNATSVESTKVFTDLGAVCLRFIRNLQRSVLRNVVPLQACDVYDVLKAALATVNLYLECRNFMRCTQVAHWKLLQAKPSTPVSGEKN